MIGQDPWDSIAVSCSHRSSWNLVFAPINSWFYCSSVTRDIRVLIMTVSAICSSLLCATHCAVWRHLVYISEQAQEQDSTVLLALQLRKLKLRKFKIPCLRNLAWEKKNQTSHSPKGTLSLPTVSFIPHPPQPLPCPSHGLRIYMLEIHWGEKQSSLRMAGKLPGFPIKAE